MAESNDAVDLGRVLALCGFGFNGRARTALLELLPSTLMRRGCRSLATVR